MADEVSTATPPPAIEIKPSSLNAVDRRGLGEVMTWASILVCLTVIICVQLVLQAKRGQSVEIATPMLGILGGVVTAFVARGTQGAVERSGASEAFNAAARALQSLMNEHHAQMQAVTRRFLAQAPPATPIPGTYPTEKG